MITSERFAATSAPAIRRLWDSAKLRKLPYSGVLLCGPTTLSQISRALMIYTGPGGSDEAIWSPLKKTVSVDVGSGVRRTI